MAISRPGSRCARSARGLLVGREREQALLREHLAAMLAGRGGVTLVSGAAGVGKTTLVSWLSGEAMKAGALVLWGYAYDLSLTPPYGPWAEIAGHYQVTKQAPPFPPFLRDAQALAALGSQERLLAEVTEFFISLAKLRPLVLILEDLHWADQASLDLLRVLTRGIVEIPLLVLVTYRDDELALSHPLSQLLPLLVREARAERLILHGLDDDALRRLVSTWYALACSEEDRLVRYLLQHAEGNPLYTTELLRTLEEQAILQRGDEAWQLGDLTQVLVPALVRQVIELRLGQLDQETRWLLQVAAVIGPEVSLNRWSVVTRADAAAIERAVEQALDSGLVLETPRGGLRFSHAMVREALYTSVNPTRRRIWHRRVAETLAERSNPDPDLVAHHFHQAGDARAAEWLIQAGERAERSYAWQVAVHRYDAAIEHFGADRQQRRTCADLWVRMAYLDRYASPVRAISYAEQAAQFAYEIGDEQLAMMASFSRGHAHVYLGDIRQGLDEMARALQRIDSSRGFAEYVPDEMPASHLSMEDRWGTYIQVLACMGRVQEAVHLAGEHQGLTSNVRQFAMGWSGLGIAHGLLGAVQKAHEAFAIAGAALEEMNHHYMIAANAMFNLVSLTLPYRTDRLEERRRLASMSEPAWTRIEGLTGSASPVDVPQMADLLVSGAWKRAREAGEAAHRTNHCYWRHHGTRILAVLAHRQGEMGLATTLIHELLPDGPDTAPGNSVFLCANELQRLAAEIELDQTNLPTAKEWLDANDRWFAWNAAVPGRAQGEILWARYHQLAGDRSAARGYADEALALATNPRQPLALIEVHRFLGQLDAEARRFSDAEGHLAESLAVADACAAPFERALTLIELATLRSAQRHDVEAQRLLTEVRGICEPLRARPTLDRVTNLEARLVPRHPARTTGLTQRECEVLHLVAEGLTDGDIADRLFISPRTVTTHVTSILNKFGVSSRAAAVAYAARHDLLQPSPLA